MKSNPQPAQTPRFDTHILSHVLIMSPLPVILGLVFFFHNSQVAELNQSLQSFLHRQNQTLIAESEELARDVAELFEAAELNLRTLSLIKPQPVLLLSFLKSQTRRTEIYNQKTQAHENLHLPIYNELGIWNLATGKLLLIQNQKVFHQNAYGIEDCKTANLCDQRLLRQLREAAPGQVFIGQLLRFYHNSPPKVVDQHLANFATWRVGYRVGQTAIWLGIDHRHFESFQYRDVFPYEEKTVPIDAYQKGNYIYMVNQYGDMMIHPNPAHLPGVDPETGALRPPAFTDDDIGFKPLNIYQYQGLRLQSYFERLKQQSLQKASPDIFKAPNLTGTARVIVVAPILLNIGQFEPAPLFGQIIMGCSLDRFKAPDEDSASQ